MLIQEVEGSFHILLLELFINLNVSKENKLKYLFLVSKEFRPINKETIVHEENKM